MDVVGRLRISNLQEEIRNSKSGVVDELCGNGGGFLVQGKGCPGFCVNGIH